MTIPQQDKRPLIVWVMQTLLVFGILSLSIPLISRLLGYISNTEFSLSLSSNLFATLLIDTSIVAILLITWWGLQHKHRYGQWLSVSLLTLATIGRLQKSDHLQLIFRKIIQFQPLPTPPYDCWQGNAIDNFETYCGYASYTELTQHVLFELLWLLLLILLTVQLIINPKVKQFFKVNPDSP